MLDFICRLAVPSEQGGGFRVCQGLFHPDLSAMLSSSMQLHTKASQPP